MIHRRFGWTVRLVCEKDEATAECIDSEWFRSVSGVAISGKAGSGKTTLARELVKVCDERDIPVTRVSFGDALKLEVMELYGIDKQMVGGREVLIRHGLQRRLEDPFYWLRPVKERARLAQASGVIVVIDDLRFPNEYWWAIRAGLTTVRMVASPERRAKRLLEQGLDPDVGGDTETSLDGLSFDHYFRNHAGVLLSTAARLLLSDF